ncbi:fluoride efflux transporter CrcB [Sutcliffiella rhizosphaerae]|uniref:Fluoride-specific ion channel FluC n=1 Tax=Sutcliffiella rhizosphaerae TaxID=2880967 RepID=A0ABM8YP74_9BACI|nr:fluoride efflux transporter CrcB [Sutcliffiella rhizosphaerae]CAG9621793.1 Putative fluoride ion transporter CrcB [Sutcliffiella rhizosphaerae]
MYMTLLLAIGGGFGSCFRYLIGLVIMKKFPNQTLPIAILFVNIIGSFLLGFLIAILPQETSLYQNPTYKIFGIGMLGAFTTFSTFSVEAVQLMLDKQYKIASFYIVLSIAGSILGFYLGYLLSV